MKATGIVRRIDDLGRVVIPKEIRRTLRIREGDPLEIFTDREGEIILKKYSPIEELGTFAKEYAEALAQTVGCLACIADRDQIIAAAGTGGKDYLEKKISKEVEQFIVDRGSDCLIGKNCIKVTLEDANTYHSQVIQTITSAGDAIGAVMLLTKDGKNMVGDGQKSLVSVAAGFLGKQMEQ